MKRLLAIILTFFTVLVLAGCGQSGPLYLPPPHGVKHPNSVV